MANIELVINIPEEKYDAIKSDLYNTFPAEMRSWGLEAIKNGIQLPKGHGKIIDANNLLDRIGLEDNDSNREDNVGAIITLEDFDSILTIVETEESENKE